MKYIAYLYSEGRSPGDVSGVKKTVVLFQIKKNKLHRIGEYSDKFVDEFQLVMEGLEKFKALPKKAFERHEHTRSLAYANASKLREAGIADIDRVA